MRVLSILTFVGLVACSFQGKDGAGTKFAIKKKTAFYHAQYTFSHDGYEDVAVAVRIEVKTGKPSMMEVKDLTPPADKPVETVTLSASGDAFIGTSSGSVGGEYSVKLADGACCGEITFVPSADTSATFVGAKSKDLTTDEWEALIATKEYFHAQYEFTHTDYEDVAVAVRIEVKAGKPSMMEVKDLTPPADKPVETVTLSASGDVFVGTSSGGVGGEYSVKLDDGACCGEITFVPSADMSITFIGAKSKNLTVEEWVKLSGTAADTVGQIISLSPSDLGTKQIGEIFSLTASDGSSNNNMILQAHSSSGAKIDRALAHWTAVDGNAYDVSVMLTSGSGKFDVFLTEQGQNVSKLIGVVNGTKQSEATIKVAVQTNKQKYKLRVKSGTLSFEYNQAEWQSKSSQGLEAMIVDTNGKVVKGGSFLHHRYSEEEVRSNGVTYTFHHCYLVNNSMQLLQCTSGQTAFVRIAGESMVYQVDCN